MDGLYKLKKIVKANDTLSNILRYIYVPTVVVRKMRFDHEVKLRRNGFEDARYSSLKKYKGIHKGKRCFVVATGPSLRVEDLEMLKNEYSISMNSIYVSYKDTDWRPNYYVIQDQFVYEKIHQELHCREYDAMFIGSIIADRFKLPAGDNVNVFPLDLLWQQIPNKSYHTKFSDDIYNCVYSGYNVAYSALQIAVYMGFSEIYLLGTDCNYLQDKKYFAEDKNRGREGYFTKKFYAANTDKFILAYEVAKEFADTHGIKIYNATRGGLLEIFPRVNLDEVVKQECPN